MRRRQQAGHVVYHADNAAQRQVHQALDDIVTANHYRRVGQIGIHRRYKTSADAERNLILDHIGCGRMPRICHYTGYCQSDTETNVSEGWRQTKGVGDRGQNSITLIQAN